MNRKLLFILIASMMIFSLAACTGTSEDSTLPQSEEISQGAPEDTDADTAEGHDDDGAATINAADIFSQRCSGCHGENREGDNGPALLPDVLTKDPSAYVATITNGSSPMPAWGNRLSADEINTLVEFIMSDSK